METIYARNTTVALIESSLAQHFIETHHRAGPIRLDKCAKSLGLFHETELIGVIQFGSPRTAAMKRKYSLELLRLAFKKGIRVSGGVSKLISHYKATYSPPDFFTYQDVTGLATDAYQHAGMTFVSQALKKQYLIAPGKTRKTGSRKEVLGMAYAVRFGPDRILGTAFGELFKSNGARKTNVEIFIEDLGWHVEETDGDRIYQWINPAFTFYTYKVTATDSEKYYYGVSHVKKINATIKDCLNDGYYGSGGVHNINNKFVNWKTKHRNQLRKEIITIHKTRMAAYGQEYSLIGDSYKIDKNCLNSVEGGREGGMGYAEASKSLNMKFCSIHGEAFHKNDSCMKCASAKARFVASCPEHGQSIHSKQGCLKCFKRKSIRKSECPVHGLTIFDGNLCKKCGSLEKNSWQDCAIHGRTKFQGNVCCKCQHEQAKNIIYCPHHGHTKHIGESCYKCAFEDSQRLLECPVHGLTKHRGRTCYKCSAIKLVTLKACPIHGESKHRGNSCYRCSWDKGQETRKKNKANNNDY